MKTLFNDKIVTIEKFDNFDECKKLLFDYLNEHLCIIFNNDLSKLTYDEMNDINYYFNTLKNHLNVICNDMIDNIYLYDDNDVTLILYMNDCDDDNNFCIYDIYDMCFDSYIDLRFFNNEKSMNEYIVDELNKQILCDNVSRETHNN